MYLASLPKKGNIFTRHLQKKPGIGTYISGDRVINHLRWKRVLWAYLQKETSILLVIVHNTFLVSYISVLCQSKTLSISFYRAKKNKYFSRVYKISVKKDLFNENETIRGREQRWFCDTPYILRPFFFLFTSGYTDSRMLRKITWKDHSSSDSAWRGTSRWTYTNSDIEMRRGGKFIVPLPLCLDFSLFLSLCLSLYFSLILSREVFDIPMRLASTPLNKLNHSSASISSGIRAGIDSIYRLHVAWVSSQNVEARPFPFAAIKSLWSDNKNRR